MKRLRNYIDGKFSNSENIKWISSYNPANGLEICKIEKSNLDDVNNAVKSAKEAFAEFEKIYGRGWYYYEGWNPATYKELPWITRFHPDYKLYLAYNRRKKRERQVRRDSK